MNDGTCTDCACVGCSEGNCCDQHEEWLDQEEAESREKFLKPIKDDPLATWAKEMRKGKTR